MHCEEKSKLMSHTICKLLVNKGGH